MSVTLAFVPSSKPLPVSNWKPGISFHCWQRPALPISTLHSDSLWSMSLSICIALVPALPSYVLRGF